MTPGRKLFLGCGGLLALSALALYLSRVAADRRFEGQFQDQLRLARAEGIPTTAAELAGTMPTAPRNQNAASLYRSLRRVKAETNLPLIDADLLLRLSPGNLALAKDKLKLYSQQLSIADTATKLPRCAFQRDWSEGAATLMPEYPDMKSAAKALALRGSIAVVTGHPADATRDAFEILTISKHAGEEGLMIPVLVQYALREIALQHLALWALRFPKEPLYREALAKAIADWPKVSMKRMYRDELFSLLQAVDMLSTEQGRSKFGLREENVSPLEGVAAIVKNRTLARAEIVGAERKLWKALGLPVEQRDELAGEAESELRSALIAFPTAYDILDKLGSLEEVNVTWDRDMESRRRCYQVALQALKFGTPPKQLDTNGWLSPYDGKPLTYKWDGRQIFIDARNPGSNAHSLKIPTDGQLKGEPPLR